MVSGRGCWQVSKKPVSSSEDLRFEEGGEDTRFLYHHPIGVFVQRRYCTAGEVRLNPCASLPAFAADRTRTQIIDFLLCTIYKLFFITTKKSCSEALRRMVSGLLSSSVCPVSIIFLPVSVIFVVCYSLLLREREYEGLSFFKH